MILRNGTTIETGLSWCRTTLPNGHEIFAIPNDETPEQARKLGYGDRVGRCTRDHDALHAIVTDALGMTASTSLMVAAGCSDDHETAAIEEAAVLAVQRLAVAINWEGPRE